MLLKSEPRTEVETREKTATGIVRAAQDMGFGQEASSVNKLNAKRVILVLPVGWRPVEAVDTNHYGLRHAGDGNGSCNVESYSSLPSFLRKSSNSLVE